MAQRVSHLLRHIFPFPEQLPMQRCWHAVCASAGPDAVTSKAKAMIQISLDMVISRFALKARDRVLRRPA